MKKRIFACLSVMIILSCLVAVQAATFPAQRGSVNDDAAVLNAQTISDVEKLNTLTSADYIVVTRHFLGGKDAQTYCDDLFAAWSLGEKDLLLLLVIGEEKYACSMGSKIGLSSEQLNSLFSSRLREPFIMDRNYDAAVGAFLLSASSQIARGMGETLDTSGLFGSKESTGSAAGSSSANGSSSGQQSWTYNLFSGFFSDDDLNDPYIGENGNTHSYESDSGFSMGRFILIAVVLLFIIRGRKKKGKSGLGPAGWMTLGLGARHMMHGGHRRR